MSTAPKNTYDKIKKVHNGWKTLRPGKSFSGMTLAEFEKRISASDTVRETIVDLENKLTAAHSQRDEADAAGLVVVQAVVNAVKGDLDEGENGELYEAMGYVRKSERKSGLQRKGSVPATADSKA
jgi:hypothetical protein